MTVQEHILSTFSRHGELGSDIVSVVVRTAAGQSSSWT